MESLKMIQPNFLKLTILTLVHLMIWTSEVMADPPIESPELRSEFKVTSLKELENTELGKLRDHEVKNLDLRELIDFSKKNNKLYQVAEQNIEIARGELVTAGLLPNPQVFYSQSFIGGIPGSEGGSAEHAPGMSIELDLFGKRGKRQEVAQLGISIEKLNFLDFDRIFKFQFKQTYREYLLLSEQLKYKKNFFSTYLTLIEASKVRLEKGDISGVEFDRLDLERIGYEADYRATGLQLIDVSQRMRRFLGIPPSNTVLDLKGKLEFVPLSKFDVIKSNIFLDRRPDLASILSRAEQADTFAGLKRREVFPSPTLGGEFRKKGNEGYFGFSVTLPIPVFNRNQGEVIKAQETSKKLRLEAEVKRKEITAELQTRLKELQIREQMLLKYEELGLLEKNRIVAERSRFAYLRRAYSIVALLESQRNYINVQRSYFEQLYLYYTAIDGFIAASEGT